MNEYLVTFERTYKVSAESGTAAVADVIRRESGPDDFIVAEVERVEELIPQPPLRRTVERSEWA